ncbi:MAG TPA: hypothetical protein VII11_09590 [Bacteroidota bacterium]
MERCLFIFGNSERRWSGRGMLCIALYDSVFAMLSKSTVHLSLSHTKSTVVAFVVIEKKNE